MCEENELVGSDVIMSFEFSASSPVVTQLQLSAGKHNGGQRTWNIDLRNQSDTNPD